MKLLSETSEGENGVILMEDGTWKIDPECVTKEDESDDDDAEEENMPSYFKRQKGIPPPPTSTTPTRTTITTAVPTIMPAAQFPYATPSIMPTGLDLMNLDTTEELYRRIFGEASSLPPDLATVPAPRPLANIPLPTPPITPTNVSPYVRRTTATPPRRHSTPSRGSPSISFPHATTNGITSTHTEQHSPFLSLPNGPATTSMYTTRTEMTTPTAPSLPAVQLPLTLGQNTDIMFGMNDYPDAITDNDIQQLLGETNDIYYNPSSHRHPAGAGDSTYNRRPEAFIPEDEDDFPHTQPPPEKRRRLDLNPM